MMMRQSAPGHAVAIGPQLLPRDADVVLFRDGLHLLVSMSRLPLNDRRRDIGVDQQLRVSPGVVDVISLAAVQHRAQ